MSCALVMLWDEFSFRVARPMSKAYGPERKAGTYGFAFLGLLTGSESGKFSPEGRLFAIIC